MRASFTGRDARCPAVRRSNPARVDGRQEFILRFTLSHPGRSTTIVGTANPAHLNGNIAMAEKGSLPPDRYEEAKKRLPNPAA